MFHAVKKKITKFHDPSVWFLPCICPRLLSLFLLSLYLLCKTPTLVKSNPLPPLGLPLGTWTITSPPECLPKLFSMQQSNFLKSPYPLKPFNLFTAFRIESKPIHILCGTLHALTLSYLSNLLFQHTPHPPLYFTLRSFWNVPCSPSLFCLYICCSFHGQWYPTSLLVLTEMSFSLGSLPDTLPMCSIEQSLEAALSLSGRHVVLICFPHYNGNFLRVGRAFCSLLTWQWLAFRMLIITNYLIILNYGNSVV